MRLTAPGPLSDGEIDLVRPSPRWVDDFLLACAHPQCWHDPATHWSRDQLLGFVQRHPNGTFGHNPGDRWDGYYFWLRPPPTRRPPIPIAGTLSLRLGDDDDLVQYYGHIGYGVFPPARGQHYAERACRLVLPLAKRNGLNTLWITCNPDNLASRRTCERLGATFVDTVAVPARHALFERGEHAKCRYRLSL